MYNKSFNEEEFKKMSEYTLQTENRDFCVARAKQVGIEADGVTMSLGCIARIPLEQIGEGVHLGLYSYLNGNVTVEDHVLIGPHCSIVAGNHKFDPKTGWFSARTEKDGDDSVVIGYGSWLASNVTVTPGVKIGRANLICAGAVVTKSTDDYAIMAGVPAKKIGEIDPNSGEYIWYK